MVRINSWGSFITTLLIVISIAPVEYDVNLWVYCGLVCDWEGFTGRAAARMDKGNQNEEIWEGSKEIHGTESLLYFPFFALVYTESFLSTFLQDLSKLCTFYSSPLPPTKARTFACTHLGTIAWMCIRLFQTWNHVCSCLCLVKYIQLYIYVCVKNSVHVFNYIMHLLSCFDCVVMWLIA